MDSVANYSRTRPADVGAVQNFSALLHAGKRCALAVVLGPGAEELAGWCDRGGGGWRAAANLWRSGVMPYVVAVASNRRRVLARNPRVMLARDLDALRSATDLACSMLDDTQCLWLVRTDAEAERIVGEATLADAVAEGAA